MIVHKLASIFQALFVGMSGCNGSKEPEQPPHPTAVEKVSDDVFDRLDAHALKMQEADLRDGNDNYDETAFIRSGKAFLRDLEGKEPVKYRNFIFRLQKILSERKNPRDDEDVRIDIEALDTRGLYEKLERRLSMVRGDGTVKFPAKEAEQKTSLVDLTVDDDFLFEAANPKTQELMGISAKEPFMAFRLKKAENVKLNKREMVAQPGTIVTKVNTGNGETALYRVIVLNGDRIIDTLSRGFTVPTDLKEPGKISEPGRQPKVDGSKLVLFEDFFKIKMPDFSLDRAKDVFAGNIEDYRKIMIEEYSDLLGKPGIEFEKHFVYFLQWTESNAIPPTADSIRAFFDELRAARKSGGTQEEKKGARGNEVVDKANRALQGERDADENILGYQDGRRVKAAKEAEVIRQNHGPLFAILRLGGTFFDKYTYNRLMSNYTAQIGVAVGSEGEFLDVEELNPPDDPDITPIDILQKANRYSTFVERLNGATMYGSRDDAELKKDLAYSEGKIAANNVKPSDFSITYGSDGRIADIRVKGEIYNPSRVILPPSRLRGLPEDRVFLDIGGIKISFNLQDYFDRYRRLEDVNQNFSQEIQVFDQKRGTIVVSRNPHWFVENGDAFYRNIAEQVTRGAKNPIDKVIALGHWVQEFFSYHSEANAEINKLALGTIMDVGGDCEDGYTLFKTLANSIGAGDYVAGVIFDDHVAPAIKGRHGRTVYKIDGAEWTHFEMATHKGVKIAPGETAHKDPKIYILPDGKIISASKDYIVVQMVTINRIDSGLLANFRQAAKELRDFLDNPAKWPKDANLDDRVKAEGEFLLKTMTDRYNEIAQAEKMAREIALEKGRLGDRWNEYANKWNMFLKKRADEVTAEDLRGQPEKVKKSFERYQSSLKHFAANIGPAIKAIADLMVSYRGKENNLAAMEELTSRMVETEVGFGVVNAAYVMSEEYETVLRLSSLPDGIKQKLKKVVDHVFDLLNSGIEDPRKPPGIQKMLNFVNDRVEKLRKR